jgi:hypothetical protein
MKCICDIIFELIIRRDAKEGGEDRAAYRRAPGEGDKERGNPYPDLISDIRKKFIVMSVVCQLAVLPIRLVLVRT